MPQEHITAHTHTTHAQVFASWLSVHVLHSSHPFLYTPGLERTAATPAYPVAYAYNTSEGRDYRLGVTPQTRNAHAISKGG